MADFTYTRAHWSFCRHGAAQQADRVLKKAIKGNPHVPAFLLGERPLPPEPPAYIGFGDEQEARLCHGVRGRMEAFGRCPAVAGRPDRQMRA